MVQKHKYISTKDLHKNVYSSFIHDPPNLQAAQMNIHRECINRYIHLVEYYSVISKKMKKKENNVDESQKFGLNQTLGLGGS